MFVKKLLVAFIALIVVLSSVTVCYAESNFVLSQAYAWEQNIDVYIAGDMSVSKLICKVSNQIAEVKDRGLLTDKNVTVRTTILLDVSKSIPSDLRGNVKSYIDGLIQNISKNEQYKIVTFGEQITVLQDFTSDRYDLAIAVNKIEFNEKESKIYDAIYNTIPKIQPIDNLPYYYRTIVITDGIDDTASGITKEELYLKLQADTYPIDMVAVSKVKQTEPKKELSALTRLSGGRYVNLYTETDISELTSNLAVNNVVWLRIVIPDALLDGSTRQFNILDGANSVEFDFKVPVFETATEVSVLPTDFAEELIATPITAPPQLIQTPDVHDNVPVTSKYMIVVFIGAGVAVIIIAVIVAVILVRGKKSKNADNNKYVSRPAFDEKTEILGVRNYTGKHNEPTSDMRTGEIFVRLRNTSNPDEIWEKSLMNGIVIGRSPECHVRIDEKSVARKQCVIYLSTNNTPTIENLSTSNITQINGEKVDSPHTIYEGDKLKLGRVILMADSFYNSKQSNTTLLDNMTLFIEV